MGRHLIGRPVAGSPDRAPGSVRRTSHVDIEWQVPGAGVMLRLGAAARDLVTDRQGRPRVLASASADAGIGMDRRLLNLSIDPDVAAGQGLLGTVVGPGFRSRVAALLPETARTPLGLLLDDLPVAALISGYATMRAAALASTDGLSPVVDGVHARMADLCSGWRVGGTMLDAVATRRGIPVQDCPAAPPLDADDPWSWHAAPPLAIGAMRRRRRIDVAAVDSEQSVAIDAMFRDTYGEPGGHEGVLHEYTVTAMAVDGVLRDVVAVPRVLPAPECPAAAAFVGRLDDVAVSEVRSAVRSRLTGTESCTHLNDLLRCLEDVGALTFWGQPRTAETETGPGDVASSP